MARGWRRSSPEMTEPPSSARSVLTASSGSQQAVSDGDTRGGESRTVGRRPQRLRARPTYQPRTLAPRRLFHYWSKEQAGSWSLPGAGAYEGGVKLVGLRVVPEPGALSGAQLAGPSGRLALWTVKSERLRA